MTEERNMAAQKPSSLKPYHSLEGYVEGYCYKSHHLNWIKTHNNFVPEKDVCEPVSSTYFEIMKEVYTIEWYEQKWAYVNLQRDMWYHRSLLENNMRIINQLMSISSSDKKYWFVTIGFNHQEFKVSSMMSFVSNLMNYEWITYFKGKFEMYRENGQHPHIHIKLSTEIPKSKIIEKIYACRGAKKIILSKTFIDVKMFLPCHDLYLNGVKQDSKMEYVEMDNEYRIQNDIPTFFSKENS